MNKGMKIAIAVVLLVAAGAYSVWEYKKLHPNLGGGAGHMMPGMRPGMPGMPGMRPGMPGKPDQPAQ